MKKTLFFLGILTLSIYGFSQESFQVRYDYDASGNANFIADNYTKIPVYVSLNFSYLDYASFMEELPYIKRIEPGTSPLFTIYREQGQPSPSFNIEVKWYPSHPSPEVDPEYPYLIPVKPGVSVKISDDITNGNSRSVGFIPEGSSEICAARKGVVVKIMGNNHPDLPLKNQQLNLVQVLHEDGTIGEYFHFGYREINCQPGETVIPGQVLGKAARLSDGNPYFGFSLFHSDLYSDTPKFLIPEFFKEGDDISQLENGKSYKAVQDDKIVRRELTRKEKKALKK